MAKHYHIHLYTHAHAALRTDPVYAACACVYTELKQKVNTTRSAPLNNERSHRQEYKRIIMVSTAIQLSIIIAACEHYTLITTVTLL